MERREFVRLLLASGLSLHGLGAVGCATPPVAVSPSKGAPKGKVFIALAGRDPEKSILRVWEWDTNAYSDYDLPISLPHSFVQDHTNPSIVTIFEAFGSCTRVDLTTTRVSKIDHRRKEGVFNGHGILSASGEKIFCTEMNLSSGAAVVGIRLNKTLEKIGELPRNLGNAHHITLVPGTTTAVIGNMAGADGTFGGGITFLDYEKNQVINRVEFDQPVSHVLPLSKDEALGLTYITNRQMEAPISPEQLYTASSAQSIEDSNSRFGSKFCPLYYAKSDGTKKVLFDEGKKELFQRGFGLTRVHGSQRFLTSYPGSGSIFLWKDLAIEKIFSIPEPMSMTVAGDASEFLVVSHGKLKRYSLATLSELPAPEGLSEVKTIYPCFT